MHKSLLFIVLTATVFSLLPLHSDKRTPTSDEQENILNDLLNYASRKNSPTIISYGVSLNPDGTRNTITYFSDDQPAIKYVSAFQKPVDLPRAGRSASSDNLFNASQAINHADLIYCMAKVGSLDIQHGLEPERHVALSSYKLCYYGDGIRRTVEFYSNGQSNITTHLMPKIIILPDSGSSKLVDFSRNDRTNSSDKLSHASQAIESSNEYIYAMQPAMHTKTLCF